MEVKCPTCQARYDIDPAIVKTGPARLQCSSCQRTFKLQVAGQQKGWMVRITEDGRVMALDDLPTLQRWIVERRVCPEDEISRTGTQWKPLGAITELSSFFAVIEQLDRVSSTDLPAAEMVESMMAGLEATVSLPQDSLVHTAETAQVDPRSVFSSMLDDPSVEAALDGLDEDADGTNALEEALLASLEKSAERKPMSGVHNPDKLRELIASQADDPFAKESLLAQPALILEATAIETPKGFESSPGTPSIGPTGDGWFKEPEASALNLGGEHNSQEVVDAIIDDEYAPRSNASMILVMVAALLVGGGIVFVLLNNSSEQSSEAGADEQASVEPQDTGENTEAPVVNTPEVEDVSADLAVAEAQADVSAELPAEAPIPHPQVELIQTTSIAGAALGAFGTRAPTPSEVAPPAEESDNTNAAASFDTLLKRGKRARSEGDHKDSLRYYTAALDQKPRNPEAITGVGWANLNLGNTGRAISLFKRAIDYSDRYQNAYIGLAKAYQRSGDNRAAHRTYLRYLNEFPDGGEASIARAQSEKLAEKLGLNKPKEPPKEVTPPKVITPPKDTTPPKDPDDGKKKIIIIKK